VRPVSQKTFQAIRKTRVTEVIVEQVRHRINSGHLKAGDRLPPERDLAKDLGVGRSAVREAIRALEFLGLVETKPGEGTFLAAGRESPAASLLDPDRLGMLDTVRKLLEVRRVIEPDLAALAAQRATPEQVGKLRAALEEQRGQVERGESGIEADTAFHVHLAEAAGNEFLSQIMDSLMERIHDTRETWLQRKGRPFRSVRDHQLILRAIEKRDPKAAERSMRRHLEGIERMLFTAPDGATGLLQPLRATAETGVLA
jgi:GntR family transcriptional regulator, transcriptional repressor for pyruvate dehydrogenase complex